MKSLDSMGEALLTDLDLQSLHCLVCGCQADGNTMRVTQAEDNRWLAICDDCCEFFGAVSAWRRAFRLYDAIVHAKRSAGGAGPEV
jgi:ribosome-binding protein aMBF1 (putative translation factor)